MSLSVGKVSKKVRIKMFRKSFLPFRAVFKNFKATYSKKPTYSKVKQMKDRDKIRIITENGRRLSIPIMPRWRSIHRSPEKISKIRAHIKVAIPKSK